MESAGSVRGSMHCFDNCMKNEYNGFRPTHSGQKVPILDTLPSPVKFFRDYVLTRTPVVINATLPDKEWRGSTWTVDALAKKDGMDAEVEVEQRTIPGTFGLSAPKIRMPFAKFLAKVGQGSTEYYITTQEIAEDEEGLPSALYSSPLTELRQDFPLVPHLLGNLIPSNINVWMGNSPEGSCSGLHHDFHDNLYIVVRGRKVFDLYSPGDAEHMYLHGELARVHPNGLINYEGTQNVTREDGVPYALVADKMKESVEHGILELEKKIHEAKGKGENEENIAAMEEELEKLESHLDAYLDCDMSIGEGDLASEDEEEDDEPGGEEGEDDEEDGCDGEEDDEGSDGTTSDTGKIGVAIIPEERKRKLEDEGGSLSFPSTKKRKVAGEQSAPDHFSKIDLKNLKGSDIERKFPSFLNAKRMVCQVQEGQMLFLPASWFHNVTSYNREVEGAKDAKDNHQCHIAFNYWTHPPSGVKFEKPYVDDFWQQRFQKCQSASSSSSSNSD